MRKLVILGGGGHAKVIIELLREAAAGFEWVGLVDPNPAAGGFGGLARLGGDEQLPALREAGVTLAFPALGDNERRFRAAAMLHDLGFELPNAVSARAAVSPSAQLGRGVAVMAGAVINADAQVGNVAIINSGAIVEHESWIGDGVHLAPNCAIGGGVRIGARSFVGLGASILPGLTLGADVRVGAGACVIRDVSDGVTLAGVPARPLPQINRD